MARLVNLKTGEYCYLKAYHTFGRKSTGIDTRVPAAEVSNIHAAIVWQADHWFIKDLSRNGTWVSGVKLKKLINTQLKKGQQMYFASPDHCWLIEDISPPISLLYQCEKPQNFITLEPYTLLPNEEEPECALSINKGLSTWSLFDINDATHEHEPSKKVELGDIVSFSNKQWQLFLPDDAMATKDLHDKSYPLNQFQLTFKVSMDEEHIELLASRDDEKFSFENKTHHYLLLHLARKMIKDFHSGLSPEDCGWLDNSLLSRELGLDNTHINILIFRIRKHFSKTLVAASNPENIIERRSGSTRISKYAEHITIIKGGSVETPLELRNISA